MLKLIPFRKIQLNLTRAWCWDLHVDLPFSNGLDWRWRCCHFRHITLQKILKRLALDMYELTSFCGSPLERLDRDSTIAARYTVSKSGDKIFSQNKQITVWEDHFTVELKSGLKIDIEG